jgi:hypothetical protein
MVIDESRNIFLNPLAGKKLGCCGDKVFVI